MAELKDVMTPKQVADYLQLHLTTVYRHINQGKIPAAKIGGRYRIKRQAVERLLAETNVMSKGSISDPYHRHGQ